MSPLAAALLLLPSALAQEPEGRLPVHVTYEDGLWFKSDDGGGRTERRFQGILIRFQIDF